MATDLHVKVFLPRLVHKQTEMGLGGGGGPWDKRRVQGNTSLKDTKLSWWGLLQIANVRSRVRFTPLCPPIQGLHLPPQFDSRSPPLCERQNNNVCPPYPPLLSWCGAASCRFLSTGGTRMRSIAEGCHELFNGFSFLTLKPLVCHFIYLRDSQVWIHYCIPWRVEVGVGSGGL